MTARARVLALVVTLGCARSSTREVPAETARAPATPTASTGPGVRMFGDSPEQLARVRVKKYAFEAYPQWAVAHPDRACPDALTELDEYMVIEDAQDPWGGSFVMRCGPNLPPGVKGIAIASPGRDGQLDTADDIRSWD